MNDWATQVQEAIARILTELRNNPRPSRADVDPRDHEPDHILNEADSNYFADKAEAAETRWREGAA